MAKPDRHAISTAMRFGGDPEDYIELFATLDRSKGYFADNRHRYCSHTSIIIDVATQVWGEQWRRASDGVEINTRALVELHILEDYGQQLLQDRKQGRGRGSGFIPTVDDWLTQLPLAPWMLGSDYGTPPSLGIDAAPSSSLPTPAPGAEEWLRPRLNAADQQATDRELLEPESLGYARSIHEFLDQAWAYFPDCRALSLTHNPYWIYALVPSAFPTPLRRLDGGELSSAELARIHVEREIGVLPTLGDWIAPRPFERWMQNGAGLPPLSAQRPRRNQP